MGVLYLTFSLLFFWYTFLSLSYLVMLVGSMILEPCEVHEVTYIVGV